MGVLRDVVKKADNTPQMTAEIKETLHLLYDLCESRANEYETQVATELRTAGTVENPTVPISLTLGKYKEIRVTTEKTPNTDITNGIKTGLKSALTGSRDGIIDGLTGLIETGLGALLGAGAGEERMQHSYYVATDGLSIVRLDLIFHVRAITAKSITAYAEKSVVCVASKSSVNLAKIDFNSFLSSYQAQLVRCKFGMDELKKELNNAREIYELLVPKKGAPKDQLKTIGVKPGETIANQVVKVNTPWPYKGE